MRNREDAKGRRRSVLMTPPVPDKVRVLSPAWYRAAVEFQGRPEQERLGEEYLNDAFEKLENENPKPEELANHTRSMLERDEAESALEAEPAKRTIRDIYEQFQPVVVAQVFLSS